MPVVGTTPDAPVGLEVQSGVVETVVGAVLQIVPHLVRSVAILPSHEGTGVGPSLESRCRDGTVEHAIFDTVLDDPHWKANLFLPDDYKNTGKESDTRKLFNVAITRAKFELFVVGDFKFLQAHAKNNALSELLDKLINKMHLRKIDAKKLLPNLTYTRPASASVNKNLGKGQVICKETDFMDLLKKDIASFKTRMIIYSPFMTLNRLADLRPHFADAINAGKTITVITKSRSDRGKRELPTYIECEKGLKDLGIEVIHKKGMHEKLIFVDKII